MITDMMLRERIAYFVQVAYRPIVERWVTVTERNSALLAGLAPDERLAVIRDTVAGWCKSMEQDVYLHYYLRHLGAEPVVSQPDTEMYHLLIAATNRWLLEQRRRNNG